VGRGRRRQGGVGRGGRRPLYKRGSRRPPQQLEPTAVAHGRFFNLMIYFLVFNFMTKKN
jgi:hypothetical protein